MASPSPLPVRSVQRSLWIVAGGLSMAVGIVGIFLPLLPTVPFLLLAAMCFSRGCKRCERWLLDHPRFGPPLRAWREHHALPLSVKRSAIVMMAIGSGLAWWGLDAPLRYGPALVCSAVAWWMWRLPTR